jgi:hypothetical protein
MPRPITGSSARAAASDLRASLGCGDRGDDDDRGDGDGDDRDDHDRDDDYLLDSLSSSFRRLTGRGG